MSTKNTSLRTEFIVNILKNEGVLQNGKNAEEKSLKKNALKVIDLNVVAWMHSSCAIHAPYHAYRFSRRTVTILIS